MQHKMLHRMKMEMLHKCAPAFRGNSFRQSVQTKQTNHRARKEYVLLGLVSFDSLNKTLLNVIREEDMIKQDSILLRLCM